MAYYKKIIFFLVVVFTLFLLKTTSNGVEINGFDFPLPNSSNCTGNYPSNISNFTNYIICWNGLPNDGNPCLVVFPDDFTGKVYIDGTSTSAYIRTSPSLNYSHFWYSNGAWSFMANGQYSNYHMYKPTQPSVSCTYSTVDIYTNSSLTNILINASSNDPTPSLDIRFPTASSNLIGIAQGNERTIEVELLNYNVEQMPDFLYLNFYKKQGNNYNIYSIPIYIYNQFPTYVTQAPLNDDLFLFVDKSKLYSMGINFQSSDEFYLFLSDDVAPKGYSSWNDNGTGLLLGTTFETTDATIYNESGLITIPTLTNRQQEANQNQSDTQKQIDAINKQTEEQEKTNDFLTNDNIDDSNISLPSINTNDITEDGIDNIFTAIYNGLTSGEARDIVLPFPFTNKSITIPANYTEQFLTTSVFSPIYLIIQAFYWYIIARFIIKDIANKFEKIKSGNIENIENNNIKTDML